MSLFLASYVWYSDSQEEAEDYMRRQDEEFARRHAEYTRMHPGEVSN